MIHEISGKQNTQIICYLALYIDCVLHVYLCNRLKFLEIAIPSTQNIIDPETLFMNPPKSLRSQV